MGDYIEDLLYCLKISIYFFVGAFIFGMIAGTIVEVIVSGVHIKGILMWGCRSVQFLSIFGLAIAGISFMKTEFLRPLNYQDRWEMYFKKFNLSFVIFFIAIFIAIISYTVETFLRFL